jgi:hypothetical protein
MKMTLVFLLFAVLNVTAAESLRLQDGTVYKNVIIIGANPEKMLVAHDGGGCQVNYEALAPDSLTQTQRESIEQGLRVYADREFRREALKQEQAALRLTEAEFAEAQRTKGLILFEDQWMKPADRQEVMALRALDRLELERQKLEIAKEEAVLQKELLLAERERQALEAQSRNETTYIYTSGPSYSRHPSYCAPTYQKGKSRHTNQRTYSSGRGSGGVSVSFSSGKTTAGYPGNKSGAWCNTTRSRRH